MLTITIWTALTIIIVTSLQYMKFESISEQYINQFNINSLSQISYSTSFMEDSAKALSLQMYFDNDIKKMLYTTSKPIDSVTDIYTSFPRLSSYKNANPLIESILIYNNHGEEGLIFTDNVVGSYSIDTANTTYDKDVFNLLENMSAKSLKKIIPRRIPDIANATGKKSEYTALPLKNVYTYIFYDGKIVGGKISEGIVINISESWLRNIIDTLNFNRDENQTYIIDSEGRTMISTQNMPMFTDLSSQDYIRTILASKTKNGYIVETVGRKKYLITYIHTDFSNWTFISQTPYDIIAARNNKLKAQTLAFALLILLMGIMVSIVISKKLYKPLDSKLTALKKLEKESRDNLMIKYQDFLRELLEHKTDITDHRLEENCRTFNTRITPKDFLLLILIKLDGYNGFCNTYDIQDQSLFKFGILNIASEICSRKFVNEYVDLGKDKMALILSTNSEVSHDLRQELHSLCMEIAENVRKYLSLSVSSAYSYEPVPSIHDLYGEYGRLEHTLQYRMFTGHGSVLVENSHLLEKDNERMYSIDKEKQYMDLLMLGKTEEALLVLTDILSSTSTYVYTVFQISLIRVSLATNLAISSIVKNSGVTFSHNFVNFIAEINTMETLVEITNHFGSLFAELFSEIDAKKNAKHDNLIKSVCQYIDRNYPEYNLSLDTIAGEFDMSSVYLGRLFKKFMMKNISDYILGVRINKAKELLLESDMPINEIAEKVGLPNTSHFYTQFKKFAGVTPKSFRAAK